MQVRQRLLPRVWFVLLWPTIDGTRRLIDEPPTGDLQHRVVAACGKF
jgi:hypothetical protein